MSSRQRFDIEGRLTAWEIIQKEGIRELPVKPSALIKKDGHKLITYSEYAKISGTDLLEIAEHFGTEAFTLCNSGRYMVVYNPSRNSGRLRWTIMHELGHIYLGHVNKDRPVIMRDDPHYPEMERKVNRLTARLLCPSIVLHYCGVSSPEELRELTGISKEASRIQWEHLCELRAKNKWLTLPEERKVLEQFWEFIITYRQDRGYDVQLPPTHSRMDF